MILEILLNGLSLENLYIIGVTIQDDIHRYNEIYF